MDRLCYCERPLIEHDGPCKDGKLWAMVWDASGVKGCLAEFDHDLVAELIWPRVQRWRGPKQILYWTYVEQICSKIGINIGFAPAWAHVVAFLLTREVDG